MEFEDLTIMQAKSKVQHLENMREVKLKEKELNFEKTQPKSKPITNINVQGGTREDKYASFVIKDEEIDKEIEYIDNLLEVYNNYIVKELKRLDEYDEWEQKVIYMKENGMTNIKIACSTPFSVSSVKRIWRKHKNKRVES